MNKPNQSKLIQIMLDNDLSIADVASILNRSVSTIQTYRARTGVDIPGHLLQLLEYKIADK